MKTETINHLVVLLELWMLWWIESIIACETRVDVEERYFKKKNAQSTYEPNMLKSHEN